MPKVRRVLINLTMAKSPRQIQKEIAEINKAHARYIDSEISKLEEQIDKFLLNKLRNLKRKSEDEIIYPLKISEEEEVIFRIITNYKNVGWNVSYVNSPASRNGEFESSKTLYFKEK